MNTEALKDQRTPEMKREDHLRERIKTLERELEAANITIEHLQVGQTKQGFFDGLIGQALDRYI